MAGARALWIANGMKREMFGKPIIGIANSFTQLVPGHTHLHEAGQLVKKEIEKLSDELETYNEQMTEYAANVEKDQVEVESAKAAQKAAQSASTETDENGAKIIPLGSLTEETLFTINIENNELTKPLKEMDKLLSGS